MNFAPPRGLGDDGNGLAVGSPQAALPCLSCRTRQALAMQWVKAAIDELRRISRRGRGRASAQATFELPYLHAYQLVLISVDLTEAAGAQLAWLISDSVNEVMALECARVANGGDES